MAAEAADAAVLPTDYVRIKRKKTTIFIYMEPTDSVHDLRARINHITKVPTTDVKFFIDKDGEVPVDEIKNLGDQKVRARDSQPQHTATCLSPFAHTWKTNPLQLFLRNPCCQGKKIARGVLRISLSLAR